MTIRAVARAAARAVARPVSPAAFRDGRPGPDEREDVMLPPSGHYRAVIGAAAPAGPP
ncbi:hypothetical protein [Frankia sp. CiP1_Cm_nod1]|uniref:hypothetical protein n=1 Tax=Frankia sp. CiP1_Cm_nod1 TaxID=2897160 RepID=UPI00202500EE